MRSLEDGTFVQKFMKNGVLLQMRIMNVRKDKKMRILKGRILGGGGLKRYGR